MDEGTIKAYKKSESAISKQASLTRREKRYLRKYAKRINRNCCPSKNKRKRLFHIGYIGNRLCKVAVCCDCDKMQVICGKIGKFFLKRYIKRGITRLNILATLKTDDLFLYGDI